MKNQCTHRFKLIPCLLLLFEKKFGLVDRHLKSLEKLNKHLS